MEKGSIVLKIYLRLRVKAFDSKMASVRSAGNKLHSFGIFVLRSSAKRQNSQTVNLSHVASAFGVNGRRSYSSERGTFLSKLLGRTVSPHTDAHSKVLTESLTLYELQCECECILLLYTVFSSLAVFPTAILMTTIAW